MPAWLRRRITLPFVYAGSYDVENLYARTNSDTMYGSDRDLHKIEEISLSYSWDGIMQGFPWVTLGKELCKPHLG